MGAKGVPIEVTILVTPGEWADFRKACSQARVSPCDVLRAFMRWTARRPEILDLSLGLPPGKAGVGNRRQQPTPAKGGTHRQGEGGGGRLPPRSTATIHRR